eukprot:TRINITY_DN14625_c0_g1_i1.p1 TRINITY_DN14625_c0_g1~~TRINITY_DN14625_c0_g1_i1.p1  ORF type:complete len:111 (+),score=43.85 TRINITY_DN14625_c0_g1_i1:80-412(+)
MIRRPPRSTQSRSSAASDVYKRQSEDPYIAAMSLTDDTGDFGSSSNQELVVGLALLGAAAVLAIPLLAHVYGVWRESSVQLSEMVDTLEMEGQWSEMHKMHHDRPPRDGL